MSEPEKETLALETPTIRIHVKNPNKDAGSNQVPTLGFTIGFSAWRRAQGRFRGFSSFLSHGVFRDSRGSLKILLTVSCRFTADAVMTIMTIRVIVVAIVVHISRTCFTNAPTLSH